MDTQPPPNEHVKLVYTPIIYVTSELAARVLGISLEKADMLLSAPDTHDIVGKALAEDVQKSLLGILQKMVRSRWPQESVGVSRDCVVELPALPALKGVFG